jgi:hypothetical protein
MTAPDPTGQPDVERPIDLTDIPDRGEREKPVPPPLHHPDDAGVPGGVPPAERGRP